MKNQWLIYATVAVISALAGVAIAGMPNNVGTDPTIVAPASTSPETTAVPTTTEAEAPADPTSTTTTTAPLATTTTTTTDTTTTTTTTTVPPLAPAQVGVVSANGAGIGGLATRTRDALRAAGYTAARATDGTTLVDATVVYFFPSFEREAVAVAQALGLELGDVKPIEEAPEYGRLDGDAVVVYLGRDQG